METRRIGRLEVSVVGLGCNNFGMTIDEGATKEVVDAALDAGINYFDTAELYGGGKSEEWLGRALGTRRDEVLLATKWGHSSSVKDGERGGDPARVRRSLEASLSRLGTDRVDHYQLHSPDPDTPVEETLGVLADLHREGKIAELGSSNFSAAQLDQAATVAGDQQLPPFASVQNHYSLLHRTPEADGVLAACARHGVAFVPYFPLESGLLSGKYRRGEPRPEGSRLAAWGKRGDAFIDDDKLVVVDQLQRWADAQGHSMLDLAMSWLATNPRVATVIAGATKPDQVRANAAAAGWSMTPEQRAEVEALVPAPSA